MRDGSFRFYRNVDDKVTFNKGLTYRDPVRKRWLRTADNSPLPAPISDLFENEYVFFLEESSRSFPHFGQIVTNQCEMHEEKD